jgi:predicted transposase/invertase (TIGR01784 family)
VYRDHLATLAYAEQKGLQKGRLEGLQKGRLEGKREEAIAIARNLKAKGLSVDLIAETTGLSAEEIEKL